MATGRSSWKATTRTRCIRKMAAAFDHAFDEIAAIQHKARSGRLAERPIWPMIVLQDSQGLDLPQNGRRPEDRRFLARASGAVHFGKARASAACWNTGCKATGPEELFDAKRRPRARNRRARAQRRTRRMSANPHANGGALMRPLRLPEITRLCGKGAKSPGGAGRRHHDTGRLSARRGAGTNESEPQFPASSVPTRPPPTGCRRCSKRPTGSGKNRSILTTTILAPQGRVMEILSEHTCQGWLEGYLLTGRHGLFSCYEAFIHIVDSMVNQHAKWLQIGARGGVAAARSPRSIICSPPMSGARITTASAIRTPASSIMS